MKKKTIICGFAGVGKSYLAKNVAGVVDLESTPFKKNWTTYVDVATHMQDNGYTVLLSCHKELRQELKRRNRDYVVVIPAKKDKQNYLHRYECRGNNQAFIDLFTEKWDDFLDEILKEEKNVIVLNNGTISDFPLSSLDKPLTDKE